MKIFALKKLIIIAVYYKRNEIQLYITYIDISFSNML